MTSAVPTATGSSRPNNSRLSRSQSPRSGARKGTYRLLARQLGLSKYRLEIVKRSRFEFDGPIKVEKPVLRRHTSGQRLAPIPPFAMWTLAQQT